MTLNSIECPNCKFYHQRGKTCKDMWEVEIERLKGDVFHSWSEAGKALAEQCNILKQISNLLTEFTDVGQTVDHGGIFYRKIHKIMTTGESEPNASLTAPVQCDDSPVSGPPAGPDAPPNATESGPGPIPAGARSLPPHTKCTFWRNEGAVQCNQFATTTHNDRPCCADHFARWYAEARGNHTPDWLD